MAGPQPSRRNGQRPSVSPAGPSSRELDLLGRASAVVRQVQPWNAFAAGAPPVATLAGGRAPAPVAYVRAEQPRSSTLNRRVPGASLRELEGEATARPVSMATPASPTEVRDSLADFESGVARAMREFRDAGGAGPYSQSRQGEQP
jgi:hypothetical protein